MKCNEIHIRDPFVLVEDGKYYMYGTRAGNFGVKTAGFDVYVSEDLENWSEPHACFDSAKYGLNHFANWAPEVHKYRGAYYMLATFTRKHNGLRATFIMKSDSVLGPFVPLSDKPLTPEDWECLDGTLYFNREGKPYLVFCHEHTQIIDGTMCYVPLAEDLSAPAGDVVTLFAASEPYYVEKKPEGEHYVTDGPFMYRTKDDELLMIWSTFVRGKYAECVVRFEGGEIGPHFEHLSPLFDDDGGHGMLFHKGDALYFTFHSPNTPGYERPCFIKVEDTGRTLIKK